MGCCGGGRIIKKFAGQVASAALSVANVLAAAATSGKIAVDRSVVERRVAVCQVCPHLNGNRCTVCGCFISLKAGLNGASCPLNKW